MNSAVHRARISASLSTAMFGNTNAPSLAVTILDIETNITTTYDSLSKAALAINSNYSTLASLDKRKNPTAPFKSRYIVTIHR